MSPVRRGRAGARRRLAALLLLGGWLAGPAGWAPSHAAGAPADPASADSGRAVARGADRAGAPDTALSAVALADSAGLEERLRAARGRWLLVNIWATWCRPCVAETPDLVALVRALPPARCATLGVSTDLMLVGQAEAERKVADYRRRFGVPYPLVLYAASNDALTARFRLSGAIPVTLLYDPAGQEAARWERRLTKADLARIRALVAR